MGGEFSYCLLYSTCNTYCSTVICSQLVIEIVIKDQWIQYDMNEQGVWGMERSALAWGLGGVLLEFVTFFV